MSSAQPKTSSSRRKDKDDTNNPDVHLPSIGNYIFQKTVGEGNFAKVKLAKHKITGAEVAVKIIDKTQLDEKKLGKLYREVRIMKMLHHPNIVKLYEVIETKCTVFLVMEYASGGELYDYLVVHGKMKEKDARAKFRQILSAVSYCHKKRVIHRDLKAENLLLDSNLDIKIADFGFSNYFDPDSKLDTFCGSPPYAAPELFQGRRYTGPEVDIWSLGVILYVLTTGCLPFDGKNLQEMRESVCRGKYRIPFYLSDTCEKLLRKFLIRDPYKRSTLDMLIDDPWINESYPESPITADLGTPVTEDDRIIRVMETKYHLDRETILKSVRDNVYDDIAAIYYVLYFDKSFKKDGKIAEAPPSSSAISTSTTASPAASKPIVVASSPSAAPASATTPAPTSHPQAIRTEALKDAPDLSSTPKEPKDGKESEGSEEEGQSDMVPAMSRPKAKQVQPRKRRFTVGGEGDVAKYADEDEEAAEGLKKLQQLPEGVRPSTTVPPSMIPVPSIRSINTNTAPVMEQTHHEDAYATQPPPATADAGSNSQQQQESSDNQQQEGEKSGRKRHNTIVGILRNSIRRPSENHPSSPTITAISPSVDKGDKDMIINTSQQPNNVYDSGPLSPGSIRAGEENKPRSLRFTFNSNTTSTKPPDEIVQQVEAACKNHGITYKLAARFLIDCSWPGPGGPQPGKDCVKFEVEVCKLPRLKNLHGLRFKRVGGSSSDYKEICEKLLAAVQL